MSSMNVSIQGEVVERIVHVGSPDDRRIRYHIERQREIIEALDDLVERRVISSWRWLYTDKKRAYYELRTFTHGRVTVDTRGAEHFLVGVLAVLSGLEDD